MNKIINFGVIFVFPLIVYLLFLYSKLNYFIFNSILFVIIQKLNFLNNNINICDLYYLYLYRQKRAS